MRSFSLVVVIAALLLVPARPAEAQGFWRWLEELSGPPLNGPAFEISGLCWGTLGQSASGGAPTRMQDPGQPVVKWDVSPYCRTLDRKQQWVEVGVQVYMLAGDNTLTDEPNDRVDAIGFLPTATLMLDRRLGFGGGVGTRRYSTPYGHFSKADMEAWFRLRPISIINDLVERRAEPPNDDWLDVRIGWVFHTSFAEGRFGPGTARLDGGPSFFVMAGLNLIR